MDRDDEERARILAEERSRILGEVETLRYEVQRLHSRAHARSLKGRLDDLVERASELPFESDLLVTLRVLSAEARDDRAFVRHRGLGRAGERERGERADGAASASGGQ